MSLKDPQNWESEMHHIPAGSQMSQALKSVSERRDFSFDRQRFPRDLVESLGSAPVIIAGALLVVTFLITRLNSMTCGLLVRHPKVNRVRIVAKVPSRFNRLVF